MQNGTLPDIPQWNKSSPPYHTSIYIQRERKKKIVFHSHPTSDAVEDKFYLCIIVIRFLVSIQITETNRIDCVEIGISSLKWSFVRTSKGHDSDSILYLCTLVTRSCVWDSDETIDRYKLYKFFSCLWWWLVSIVARYPSSPLCAHRTSPPKTVHQPP